MNIATYKCFNCLQEFERTFEDKISAFVDCEICGKEVGFKKVIYGVKPIKKYAYCQVDAMHENHPRFSDSMGINPDQEPEVHKRFPNLDLTFDAEGSLLVKNRKHKKELMKAFGMTEFDGTSWRKSGAQVKVRRSK